MRKAKLVTRSRELVIDFLMPEFQMLPEVAVWGSRVFVIEKPFEQTFGNPAEAVYIECVAWSVSASLAMAEAVPNVEREATE